MTFKGAAIARAKLILNSALHRGAGFADGFLV